MPSYFKRTLYIIGFFTLLSCELPNETSGEFDKIVHLGKIISQPKFALFSAPIPIEQSSSSNKIKTVQIDFENQQIHFYGFTATNVKCHYDRPLTDSENSKLEKPIRDLEFCERQTNQYTACLAQFMPTDQIAIYDIQKLLFADEYPSFCEPNHPQLCNGSDIKPLFATIKELAIQDIDYCQ